MKKGISVFIAAFLVLAMVSIQGCIKDSYTTTYTYTMFTPVYKTKAQVRENIKSGAGTALVNTGKLYIYGSYIFLNEIDKGIHIIDNSNPSQPRNFAFIVIPGNRDLAVKGNYLYADLYTDLVVIDISNPENVQLKKVMENVFPHRYYESYFMRDSAKVIVEWIQKDTTVTVQGSVGPGFWLEKSTSLFLASGDARSMGSAGAAPSPAGMGGSMARFALASQMLYTVGTSDLKAFDVSAPADPQLRSEQNVGMSIETIFPFKGNLFIGSATGMYIYDISNPAKPVQQSQFNHVRSCDPVIADDQFAYVTLRSGTQCMGFTNQLEIIDIANLQRPQLVKIYQMTNPHGLSKDGDHLFICDGRDGLKVYNSQDVNNLKLVKTISGIETFDVIAWNKKALVVAKDGLYQYDYADINNIRLLSKLSISK